MELICLAKWSWESPSCASDSRNKPELPLATPLRITLLLTRQPHETAYSMCICVYVLHFNIAGFNGTPLV